MSAIEQVIARARQGEVEFAERKQFKLARTRAIEKLRRFALADPYFYILELIQAAIAGGADYVDIACSDGDVLVSWTGGYLEEAQLAVLFDFLFASKDRVDLANVRSLALGVNALLLFEPESVVIESGNGTEGGTTRMVITGGAESVDVGRAQGVLTGTYVRANKLNRSKVARETGRDGDSSGGLEYATVELRCLAAPVPIVFNNHPLFGWASQRVPGLFGYKQVRSFDEGDLYGTIGWNPIGGVASFQLLTQGVWIQTYEFELIKGQRFGGIVCFDALHKTVDHSGFVRDERFDELWIRLRPYAEALMGGAAGEVPRITSGEGIEYSPAELRALLREHPRVVVTEPGSDEAVAHRAKVIARLLDAEVLRVPPAMASSVRVLGGRDLLLWRPDLSDDEDQQFYSEAPAPLPDEPYMRPPVELECPSLNEIVERIASRGAPNVRRDQEDAESVQRGWMTVYRVLERAGLLSREARKGEDEAKIRAMLRGLLGESGTIEARLYSPFEPGRAARGLLVRVLSTGRMITEQLYASAYPGRVLDIELPSAMVTAARTHGLDKLVAEYFAALAVPVLREQDQRALAGLSVGKIELGSMAARLALQVLARVTTTRLRAARPGRLAPGLSFSLLRQASGFDPFSLALFETHSGEAISLRALSLMTDHTQGLVYGTIPEVPADLEGLDLRRVLRLDATSERTLIALIGEAGYVRVDARDVLTHTQGVQIRDIALGLHAYPDFPLLLEGELGGLASLDDAGREALLKTLLRGLIDRLHGRLDEAGTDPSELEEHRRQAVRHLQWYVCRQLASGRREILAAQGLLELPLFLDLNGEVWGVGAVFDALRSPEGLLVHYGHVLGSAELGALSLASAEARPPGQGRPASLAVSAFSYRLLQPLGRIRLAFDFDLDDVEAASNPMTSGTAFLVREAFESPEGAGVLGVPATHLPEYRVAITARAQGVIAAFDELGHLYGLVGSIELSRAQFEFATIEALYAHVDERAGELLVRLIEQLPELGDDPRRYAAALRVLLTYAGEQLTLIASPLGLSTELASPLAERILGLPLFDTGAVTLVSGHRMIELFRRHFETHHIAGEAVGTMDWSAQLAADAEVRGMPKLARSWLEEHLQPARVVMPASGRGHASEQDTPVALEPWPAGQALPLDALAWNLEHWIATMRPDLLLVRGEPMRTKIWVLEIPLASGGVFEGGDTRLEIHCEHPLIRHLSARPSAQNLAWMLLAAYAHINAVLLPVTNAHEAEFQLRVGEALMSGELRLLQPPS